MGRHIDPAVIGSRRAAVLTVTSSALLVVGGLAIVNQSGDLRLSPARPVTGSTSPTSPTASTPAPSPRPASRSLGPTSLVSVPVTTRSATAAP
jgi:hypothetical protein